MTNAPAGTIFVVVFMAWAVYRRIRRNIGRQPLRPRRIIVRLVILSLVAVLLLAMGVFAPMLALMFALGALIGVGFSFIGLRHTKFETTDEGHFYTPNTYIGVALSALLLGRMAYRLFLFQDQTAPVFQPGQPAPTQMFVTFSIAGLTIGYYLAYLTGLFAHTHDKREDTASSQP